MVSQKKKAIIYLFIKYFMKGWHAGTEHIWSKNKMRNVEDNK